MGGREGWVVGRGFPSPLRDGVQNFVKLNAAFRYICIYEMNVHKEPQFRLCLWDKH